jgi:GntR family transcriptional regulator / MocR family aminotransferase
MTRTWATSSVDLHLDLAGPRVRASLEGALREAVRSGRLAPGTRLPSSRAFAADLGIARNTVAEAYGQLVAEGWLASRHGAGTWVADRTAPPAAAAAPASALLTTAASPASALPTAAAPAGGSGAPGVRLGYDLRAGMPDMSAFPRSAWLAVARKALAAAPHAALGYTDARGLPPLRTALAEYLSRARGVAVTEERIVVCSGFSQGLELLCEVLRARGAATLAIEAFGPSRHRYIAAASGLRLITLNIDSGGASIDDLNRTDAVLLTPAHQFPLGMALEPSRRRRAAEWASRTGALIIEDDYDGELRYDRPAVGAMQALAPEHIVYAGTASKSLAPGLRLGWLVLPADLVDDVVRAKASAGRLSSSLDQLTLAEFISCGAYDRHVRRARLACRRRRDELVAALRQRVPALRITGIAAGLHVLVELPAGQREGDLVARAARRGLAVEGLATYAAPGHRHSPALIIGYATPPGHAFTAAVGRLCDVLGDPLEAG